MRRRFLIIFNPGAGRQRRAALAAVVASLEVRGAAVTLAETSTPDAAISAVKAAVASKSYDAVVAAGGDGTVRQAACALAGAALPLGYIPLGTGNVLAYELALDRSAPAIAQKLMRGPVAPIEMATANGAPFLLMAGMGFDGRVIAALDHTLKNRLGKFAFVPPALKALSAPLDDIAVTIDGNDHRATWAVVANARHYGGHFVIAPRTGLASPGLSVVLFQATSRLALVSQLIDLATGRLERRAAGRESDVAMIPANHVTLRSSLPLPLQIDGDKAGEVAELEVSRGGPGVNLIVP